VLRTTGGSVLLIVTTVTLTISAMLILVAMPTTTMQGMLMGCAPDSVYRKYQIISTASKGKIDIRTTLIYLGIL